MAEQIVGTGIECTYLGLRLARSQHIPIDLAKKGWKQAILDEFKRQGKEILPGAPFITITMPCGSVVKYQTFEDIPDEDVPCPCGNSKHRLVEHPVYEDIPGKVI